jgi:hypothetical protein
LLDTGFAKRAAQDIDVKALRYQNLENIKDALRLRAALSESVCELEIHGEISDKKGCRDFFRTNWIKHTCGRRA